VSKSPAPKGVVVAFLAATVCAMGFAAAYVVNLSTPVLGAVLGVSLALIGLALALWSKRLEAEEPEYVEERAIGPSPREQFEHFEQALTESPVPRSRFLWGMFATSVMTLGAAVAFPLRSLLPDMGEVPDDVLSTSPWTKGRRLMTSELAPIKPDDLEIGSVLTVFPENYDTRQDVAATLLLRVDPTRLQLPPSRSTWAVDGVLAYSKLCTHAGCPVGLFADEPAQLLCPCHHSVFNVLDGAQPMQGPASHPLPQLPLALDAAGYLIADGPFSGPVGAAWWGYRE
jgi:ubiquinol-cytochrome c reductase iron-sulfur subunit